MSDFPFDTVGFDLDGTLVDSSEDLAVAVNHVLATLDRPPLPLDSVRAHIGGGGRRMLRLSLAEAGIDEPAALEPQALHVNPLKYGVETALPQIASNAGSARQSKSMFWPVLSDISMYSVRITDQGMREPHWHPETAEMGYVAEGRARMTILDPDGSKDTYEVGPGDVYFIPPAYPHHIENIGTGTFHVLIFFDRASPGDIGFRTLVGSFPREVLAATFGLAEPELPLFPFTEQDPLLVTRVNPLDPIN